MHRYRGVGCKRWLGWLAALFARESKVFIEMALQ
jgi:hypothetical protein